MGVNWKFPMLYFCNIKNATLASPGFLGVQESSGIGYCMASWWEGFGNGDLMSHLCFMNGCISRSQRMGLSPLIWFLSFDFSFPDFRRNEDGKLRSGEEYGKKGSPKELFASFIWLLLHSSQKEHGLLRVGDWLSPGFAFNYIPEKKFYYLMMA